jgi:hypothetical protein
VAGRLAHAIEGLRDFPRIGHVGAVSGVFEVVVPGPTRRLTFTVGYRLRGERITVLGITWGAGPSANWAAADRQGRWSARALGVAVSRIGGAGIVPGPIFGARSAIPLRRPTGIPPGPPIVAMTPGG